MIIEKIMDFIFFIFEHVLRLFGSLWVEGINFNWDDAAYFIDIVEVVAYLFPMRTLSNIVTLVFGLILFKAGISLVRLILECIH